MWQQVEQSLHSSMGRVMNKIATLLPGILAFIVAFLFFLLIFGILNHLKTSNDDLFVAKLIPSRDNLPRRQCTQSTDTVSSTYSSSSLRSSRQ